jgi:hypothetical protein
VADVQRSGRIGRDEFDQHLAPAAAARAAKSAAFAEHLADHGELGCRRETEVDETGAGDFGLLQERRVRQFRDQQLRQLPRIALQRACQLHGQIAGKIAVRSLLRSLDVDRRVRLARRYTAQRGTHQVGEVGFQI